MNKKRGFILQFTILMIGIITTILYFLSLSIRNHSSTLTLHENKKLQYANLKNTDSIIYLEFKKIDDSIIAGRVRNLEDFVTTTSTGEKIWTSPITRTTSSIGGYTLLRTNPDISTMNTAKYIIDFYFTKTLVLKDENGLSMLNIGIITSAVPLTCDYNKTVSSLSCDVVNFTITNFNVASTSYP